MTRRNQRTLVRVGFLLAVAYALSGCTKGGQFDPTTLLDNDMFSSKDKLKGQREPVFPNGVPGASTGIPPDLVKGYQPPPEQAADNGNGATPPAAEPEPKPKPKPKPKVASAPRPHITVGMDKKPAPPAQQPSQAAAPQTAWPAPPSGTGQPLQSTWPAPPPTNNAPQQTAQPSPWPNPPAPGTATQ